MMGRDDTGGAPYRRAPSGAGREETNPVGAERAVTVPGQAGWAPGVPASVTHVLSVVTGDSGTRADSTTW
jgi:hypothetical protein